jgi:hypothetical protein
MAHPRSSRLSAILLLVVFLGAGSSLPSLDALLYHEHGPDRMAGLAHVEPAGGCTSHAEHCTLGLTAPGSSAWRAPFLPAPIRTAERAEPTPTSERLSAHRTAPRPSSRAPPALRFV